MKKATLIPVLLIVMVCFAMLLAACGDETTEPTSAPQPAGTIEVETTLPADDDASEEEGIQPETTAEIDTSPTPSPSGLTAVIVSGDTSGAGKPFTFDATQSKAGDAPIVNYIWTMGDDATLFGLSVEHVYKDPGLYTVTLIVTDEDGETDTTAKVVEVIDLEATVTPTVEGEFKLIGTSWKLNNAIRGTTVTLVFGDTTLSGSAGCNDYNTTYIVALAEETVTNISISSIRTADKLCTTEVMAQERGYLDSLASASSVTVDGDTLILVTGSGTLTFTETTE